MPPQEAVRAAKGEVKMNDVKDKSSGGEERSDAREGRSVVQKKWSGEQFCHLDNFSHVSFQLAFSSFHAAHE